MFIFVINYVETSMTDRQVKKLVFSSHKSSIFRPQAAETKASWTSVTVTVRVYTVYILTDPGTQLRANALHVNQLPVYTYACIMHYAACVSKNVTTLIVNNFYQL